jgi:hypothetical protein
MPEAYTVGEPWRRQSTGDPPGIDYSLSDDWICPVYRGSGDERQFYVDAVVTPQSDEDWSAEGVRAKAEHIASALNLFRE